MILPSLRSAISGRTRLQSAWLLIDVVVKDLLERIVRQLRHRTEVGVGRRVAHQHVDASEEASVLDDQVLELRFVADIGGIAAAWPPAARMDCATSSQAGALTTGDDDFRAGGCRCSAIDRRCRGSSR
jgi:hypothetical protein